ncbi:hypothetical protein [Streptomyces altiplanensis]
MYLPSPLTGRLVDRFGPAPIAVWAALTLLASGLVADAGYSALAVTGAVLALALLSVVIVTARKR